MCGSWCTIAIQELVKNVTSAYSGGLPGKQIGKLARLAPVLGPCRYPDQFHGLSSCPEHSVALCPLLFDPLDLFA